MVSCVLVAVCNCCSHSCFVRYVCRLLWSCFVFDIFGLVWVGLYDFGQGFGGVFLLSMFVFWCAMWCLGGYVCFDIVFLGFLRVGFGWGCLGGGFLVMGYCRCSIGDLLEFL